MTTLINSPQGVIAVVDRMPKKGEWTCAENVQNYKPFKREYDAIRVGCGVIIASTIDGVGKELVLDLHKDVKLLTQTDEPNAFKMQLELIDFTKPYEYTETETNIIVKL